MDAHFAIFMAVGFAAAFLDGVAGMGYGLSCTAFLLALGVPPVAASASVHCAEAVTSSVAGFSHWKLGNVDGVLFRRLVLPGMLGGVIGAWALTSVSGELFRPYMAVYLMVMGLLILRRVWRGVQAVPRDGAPMFPLGLAGGFLDSVGGGGWGAIVTSTLAARGHEPRFAVGSSHAVEFFVTMAQAAAFVTFAGLTFWRIIAGLILGGVLAAPLAAWLCRHVPPRPLAAFVGLLVAALSARTLWLALRPPLA